MSGLGSLAPRKRTRDGGVVSLEFAVIAPVLLLMVIGAWDIARAVMIWQQTLTAAQWVAISANYLALQPDSSTSLTPTQATFAMTAFYGAMPQIQQKLYNGIYSVTLSGVYFTANTSGTGPANTASVIWSVPLTTGNSNLQTVVRSCGTVTQVSTLPEDATVLTVVPTLGITTPTTVLVADVHYRFTPTFFNFITGPIDFWESYAFPPPIGQNNQSVCFDIANPQDGYLCPGTNQTLCVPQT